MAGSGGRDLITALVLAYEVPMPVVRRRQFLRKHGYDHVTYGALLEPGRLQNSSNLNAHSDAHSLGLAGVANVALRQNARGRAEHVKGCAFAQRRPQRRLRGVAGRCRPDGTGRPFFEGDLGIMSC